MHLKHKPEYININPNFTPLPRYGHLSEKTREYMTVEKVIDIAYSKLWSLDDFPSIRQAAGDADARMPPGGPDRRDVVTNFITFPARDGQEVELKVYKSPNAGNDATLMYRMHGGGWVIGRHEVDGAENVYAASNPNIVVVSIEYRKAPEHPFPRPFHDCYDGLLWCKKNASRLGINAEKIIISGSSAGANLAAALVIEAKNNLVTGIIAQVLHFPPLCHPKFFPRHRFEYGSYIQNKDNPVLGTLKMELFLDSYIPNPEPDYRHSPLLASSFDDLPPTLIQSGGVDILRDDAFAYSQVLEAAGVDVRVYCYKGVPHCFPVMLPSVTESMLFYTRYDTFLREHAG